MKNAAVSVNLKVNRNPLRFVPAIYAVINDLFNLYELIMNQISP